MMHFLKLIRYQNLLVLAVMQLIIRYGFLEELNYYFALTHLEFSLFVLASLCIAAAGYIINDVFDQEVDAINKPERRIIGTQIAEEKAYYLYGGLSIVGVGIGMYLSNSIGRPGFGVFFVLIVALLYVYSSSLKHMPFIGNLVIALLVGASVLLVPVFDVYPVTHEGNKLAMGALFGMLKNYAILAVMITLIREIIKDAEDVQGDDAEGMQTLPIVLGISKTNSIIAVLAVISSGAIVYYCFTHLLDNNLFYLMGYLGLFVIAPLIFIAIRVLQAKSKEDYTQLSKWVKIITVMGIFALAVLTFNLKQNVA
ncbi:MAG: hypothetical protein RLZZ500_1834 [Bacteroidota bacterium]|jgi:4-hydroxybenzoate polyprenyltransferase